ncbi:hypothetical protein FIV42_13175 [Persicimonas caeni]|uniref:Right handed beta helix domain-containing protein n=1 Tax=Persicimonas caeni TaxID=2292766 RepID=A0A4Y6PTK9_PERCE|nr:right-handed parallel beta-helix repeat-containing protein [Persicimonas caeni]QDG51666.1 hypothetical protein FIV42_13175 [Persicimonas caeni]QED32887.1 hypothetical protein FRD00_13170 [Persicimonas caeni]
MNSINWRSVGHFAIVVAFLAGSYALYPWAECSISSAQSGDLPAPVQNDGSALTLAQEARNRKMPTASTGFFDRLGAAEPVCRQRHPLGERKAGWGVSVAALLLMLISRAIAKRNESRPIVPRGDAPVGQHTGDRRSMETSSRAGGGRGGVPEAITISQELEIDLPGEEGPEEDLDALINYLEEEEEDVRQEAEKARPRGRGAGADIDGFYCPPGLEDAPVLYVDPSNLAASDAMDDLDSRVGNPERPFETIQAALDRASKLFTTTRGPVQVRVSPGVYQERLFVPTHVSLVNHRLPAEGSIRQHLDWLVAQQEVGHPDRVTLLPPADAEFAIKFEHGQRQGIFGCHVVGREGVRQQGLVAEHCTGLAVVHCAIEDFTQGGMHFVDCGGGTKQTAAQVVGCRFRHNKAVRGGAVFVRGGTLRIEKTRFEDNTSTLGGAIFVVDASGPLQLDAVGFRGNEATAEDRLTVRPDVVKLEDWRHGPGQGGALAAVRSKIKFTDCKFLENRGKISGGALALLGAQAVFDSRDSGNSFKKNQARVGGAVFVAGWTGCRATLKAKGSKFFANEAGSDGGALAIIGLAVAQVMGAKFVENQSLANDGVGGAVASLKGGQFMAKETRFRANETAGRGGAAGAINASLVLSDGCYVEENVAQGGEGGGLFCLSESNAEMEGLMNRTDFKLPFVFTTRDVAIRHNKSAGQTAGLLVGNQEDMPTFPIKVTIEKPMYVRNNKAAGGSERTGDLVVRWAREVVSDSGDRAKKQLLLN